MSPKSKSSGSPPKRKKPSSSQQRLTVLFACLALAGLLIVGLVLLARLRSPEGPPAAPARLEKPLPSPGAVSAVVENVLLKSGVSLDRIKAERVGAENILEIQGDVPGIPVLEQLEGSLQEFDGRLRLERETLDRLVVKDPSRRYLLVRFAPLREPSLPAPGRVRLAIIMDDLGRDVGTIERLLDLGLPVTYAVLPGEKFAGRAAALIHNRGGEIMIHIPMEPQSYPATDPGRDALFVGMSREDIHRRFQGFLDRIPYAVGGNNHMGSRFTEDRAGMDAVLEVMKKKGLFFVDSRTTGGSVAADAARKIGLPVLERDVFLDNQPEAALIKEQIRLLVGKAKRQGKAVGICHPHPETIKALEQMKGYFQEQNVEVVPVSRLMPG